MVRILLFLALATIGGFTGWYFLSAKTESENLPAIDSLIEFQHEFPLLPADQRSDREKVALIVDNEDRLLMAWASQTGEEENTLFLARSTNKGKFFGNPIAFRRFGLLKSSFKVNGKERPTTQPVLPRLATNGKTIALAWIEPIGHRAELLVSTSTNGGETFSEPKYIHSAQAIKPNYTSLAISPQNEITAVWLDGRNGVQQPFAGTIRNNEVLPEQMVYPGNQNQGVCHCCDLDVSYGPDEKLFVAFRAADDGFRDTFLAYREGKTFSKPERMPCDPWKFDGCPHHGPSLAISSDSVNLIWMGGQLGTHRVYVADNSRSPSSYSVQSISDSKTEQGHPRIAIHPKGGLVAVWDETFDEATPGSANEHRHGRTGSGRTIRIASIQNHQISKSKALDPKADTFQLTPTISVNRDGQVFVAWTEIDESGKRIVFTRLRPFGE